MEISFKELTYKYNFDKMCYKAQFYIQTLNRSVTSHEHAYFLIATIYVNNDTVGHFKSLNL